MLIEDSLPTAEEIYRGNIPEYKWDKLYDYLDSLTTETTRLTTKGQFILAVRPVSQGNPGVRSYLREAELMELRARRFSASLSTVVIHLMGASGYTVEHNPTTKDGTVYYAELQHLMEWFNELWKKLRDIREQVEKQRIKLQ